MVDLVKLAKEKERTYDLPDVFFENLNFLEHIRFFDDLKTSYENVEVILDKQNKKITLNGQHDQFNDACNDCDETILKNVKVAEHLLKDVLMWQIIDENLEDIHGALESKAIKAKVCLN